MPGTVVRRAAFATASQAPPTTASHLQPPTSSPKVHTPLRKQLRDEAKALKASGGKKRKPNAQNQTVPGWELTVGIEIHAQLNTEHKLFSTAPAPASSSPSTSSIDSNDLTTDERSDPNRFIAPFDLAIPGTQPIFQPEVLVPAVRAALALNCDIQETSYFDRKHYFHWDQPAGYQITQYYRPFARDGHIVLRPRDGIAKEERAPLSTPRHAGLGLEEETQDDVGVRVRIKQVQMEQDTAKTLAQGGGVHLLDYNRAGTPLIEIITEPDMHYPATAAAFVRKVQGLLRSVDACVVGMEMGGLRADVNVSVRRMGDGDGLAPLGTRTEIKNLSSFRAVEDAIIAERDRQIAVLESGGTIEGETRGWTLGSTETRRLRGKEGEVDYRYMPDPDLGPVIIGERLVDFARGSLLMLPDQEILELVTDHGLTEKDAVSLIDMDDGGRVEYYYRVLDELNARLRASKTRTHRDPADNEAVVAVADSEEGKGPALLAANWCLHELGRLTTSGTDGSAGVLGMDHFQTTPEGDAPIHPATLAELLFHLHRRRITAKVAKELLWSLFRGEVTTPEEVTQKIDSEKLWFDEITSDEYDALASQILAQEPATMSFLVSAFRSRVLLHSDTTKPDYGRKLKAVDASEHGKRQFLVGKMMRAGPEGRVDPLAAGDALQRQIDEHRILALEGEPEIKERISAYSKELFPHGRVMTRVNQEPV
jgi:aspartyl-tRNA(Asn)/glutamyl-tRNA(Gln) amidotransferase subunit B